MKNEKWLCTVEKLKYGFQCYFLFHDEDIELDLNSESELINILAV